LRVFFSEITWKREIVQQAEDKALDQEIERKMASIEFEEKLRIIKEENEREIEKLNELLMSSRAENKGRVLELEEKQNKLQELEK